MADAVAMDGCAFDGEDKLDERIVLGELVITDFEESVLRAFRADTVEVLADGARWGGRCRGCWDRRHPLARRIHADARPSVGGRPLTWPMA